MARNPYLPGTRDQNVAEPNWYDQRFDMTSGNIDYIGRSLTHKSSDMLIWKYSFDASDNITRIEGPLMGTWANRASLDWA